MNLIKTRTAILTAILLYALPIAAQTVTVEIHRKTGYEGYEAFADAAAQKLQLALNSDKFKKEVLDGKFRKTNGFTNQQIFDLIMKAQETTSAKFPENKDNVVDLHIRTISEETDGSDRMKDCKPGSGAGTYGIEGNADGVMATCPQWLRIWYETNDPAALAGHYAHEYMHQLGFSHSGLVIKRKTLVYQIGEIVEKVVRQKI